MRTGLSEQFANVLLHIGYHKTGSTYLQDHFFQAANGFSADVGDIRTRIVHDFVFPDNFAFDPDEMRRRYTPFVERAEADGLRFVLSHERLSGYPPSGGYDRVLIAQRLQSTFPGARILIIIREQLSLIRSLYSQYITDGGDLSLARFLETPEPQLGRMPGFRLEVYEFDRLITYYQRLFGADRVLVLPFEAMLRDLPGFLRSITDFMHLPPPASVPIVVTNPRRPVPMQVMQRLGNRLFSNNELSRGGWLAIPRFPRRIGAFERAFQALTPGWIESALYSRLGRDIRQFVGDHYMESNHRTSSLTGVNLNAYGYAVACDE
jgi:hypothetical protein